MSRKTDGNLARTTKYFKNLQRYRQRGIHLSRTVPKYKKCLPRYEPERFIPRERRDTTRRGG